MLRWIAGWLHRVVAGRLSASIPPHTEQQNGGVQPEDQEDWRAVTADDYLSLLFDYLTVGPHEREMRMAASSSLDALIRSHFPAVREIRLFGSFARGTSLSIRVDPKSDIDVLVSLPGHSIRTLEEEGGFFDKLSNIMMFQADCSYCKISPPCMTLQYRGFWFDVFVTLEKRPGDTYAFFGPFTAWDEEHRADLRFLGKFGLVSVEPEGATRTFYGATEAFSDGRICAEYDRVYGTAWRAFVLWLKYWKRFAVESLPMDDARRSAPWSFALERAVLFALNDHGRTIGAARPVEFLDRGLSRMDPNVHRLLSEVPGFDELRATLAHLCRTGVASPEARIAIRRAFPIPPPPTHLARANAAWFVEAQLVRAELCSCGNDELGALNVVTETWDALPEMRDPNVALPLAHAQIQKAGRLVALGRRSDAKATLRSVAARYGVPSVPEVREAVVAALAEEWTLHAEDDDIGDLTAFCEFCIETLSDSRTEEEIGRFLVACVHKTVDSCAHAGQHARVLHFCREAHRLFSDSSSSNIRATLAWVNFTSGWVAGMTENLVLAAELFDRAGQTEPEPDDPETARMIAWARFEKAFCRSLTGDHTHDDVVLECEQLATEYSTPGRAERFRDQVACARMLAVMCLPDERQDADALLCELVEEYKLASTGRVQDMVAMAREQLEYCG